MREGKIRMILIWIVVIAAVVIILFGDEIGGILAEVFASHTDSMLDQILR
jgi:hypothetical protein